MMATSPASWHQAYEPGVPISLPAVDRTFDGLLAAAAADAPGSPALVFYQRRTSFAELDAQVSRTAAALQRQGLRPGDRVVLALPNGPTCVIALLGALRAGLVAAPIDPDMPREAARGFMARSAPRLVIASRGPSPDLAEPPVPPGIPLIVVEPAGDLPLGLRLIRGLTRAGRRRSRWAGAGTGWGRWRQAAPAEPEPADIDPDSPALLLAAEGGAGDGALYTHRQLVAGATQVRLWLTDAVPSDDTWLLLSPLASAFGCVVGLGGALLLRDRAVLLPAWTPGDVEDALRCLRPSYVVADRPAMARLVADPALTRLDARSIRAWFSPAPLNLDCIATFESGTGISLCLGFAPPGVAGLATCNPVNGRRLAESIGLPLPGVAARLAAAGGPGGGQGWLELAGPNIAAPAWLATRVPARIDDSGYIFLEAEAGRPGAPG